jgi:protein-L-isoaspartate(D-aspartate) O-methyltransferase
MRIQAGLLVRQRGVLDATPLARMALLLRSKRRLSCAVVLVNICLVLGSCADNTEMMNSHDNPSLRASVPSVRDGHEITPQKTHEPMSSKEDPWLTKRLEMVEFQIRRRGVHDERVLEAMARVQRHLFVPKNLQSYAYDDSPLPIGYDQTISQPYIVALMTELARPKPGDRALEIGTGCGYQAAVLSELVDEIYSIEIVEPLAKDASTRLRQLGNTNVEVRCGDGYQGWAERAPFQIIVVAAAPDHIPQPLLDQLAPNGRMVIPVGRHSQELLLIEKSQDGSLQRKNIAAVTFVPMTGMAEKE